MGEGGQNTTTTSTHHEPLLLLGLLGGVVQQQVSSPAGLQCQQVQTLATFPTQTKNSYRTHKKGLISNRDYIDIGQDLPVYQKIGEI